MHATALYSTLSITEHSIVPNLVFLLLNVLMHTFAGVGDARCVEVEASNTLKLWPGSAAVGGVGARDVHIVAVLNGCAAWKK